MRKKRTVLTEDQRKEIIESKLSNKELAIIYYSNDKTISEIRTRAGKGVGNAGKNNGGNQKLTPEQVKRILANKEKSVDLSIEFGVTVSCISNVKRRAGIKRIKKEKPKKEVSIKHKSKSNAQIKFEQESKEIAKALKLAENFRLTTEWKLKNGWAWKPGACRSMVLRKIN